MDIKEGRRRKKKGRHGRTNQAPGTSGDRAPIRRSLGRRRNPSIPAAGSRAHEDTGPSSEPLGFAAGRWPRSRSRKRNVRGAAPRCGAGVRVERAVAEGERDRCARPIASMPACCFPKGQKTDSCPSASCHQTPLLLRFVLICPWTWSIRHVTSSTAHVRN